VRVLLLDLETTGLDPKTAEIIEIGWAVWDTERATALRTGGTLVKPTKGPVPQAITDLTGIRHGDVLEFGVTLEEAIDLVLPEALRADYLVGHNARGFDRLFLEAADPAFVGRPWIDTMTDLPYPPEKRERKLIAACAEHGFVNPFPHRALCDALSTGRLLSFYPIDVVEFRAKSPETVVQALVSFEEKELAKARGFQWQELNGKTYPKSWVRSVKACDLPALEHEAPFKVKKLAA